LTKKKLLGTLLLNPPRDYNNILDSPPWMLHPNDILKKDSQVGVQNYVRNCFVLTLILEL
jgi:hypothetical protein